MLEQAQETIPQVTIDVEKTASINVVISGKKFCVICDKEAPLGALHDALMQIKSWCVNRMVAHQKLEEQNAADVKAADELNTCEVTSEE